MSLGKVPLIICEGDAAYAGSLIGPMFLSKIWPGVTSLKTEHVRHFMNTPRVEHFHIIMSMEQQHWWWSISKFLSIRAGWLTSRRMHGLCFWPRASLLIQRQIFQRPSRHQTAPMCGRM